MNNKLKQYNQDKDFNYQEFKKGAIEKLYQGKGFTGKDGIFTGMIKGFVEEALKAELLDHINNERREGF